jgi:hypothetical protein
MNEITTFLTHLFDAWQQGTLVHARLNAPTSAAGDIKSIDLRLVSIKQAVKLSATTHHRTRDVVKNYTAAEVTPLLKTWLAEQFQRATLATTTADWLLEWKKGAWKLTSQSPRSTEAPELSHDRAKTRHITAEGAPYLHALGITDGEGRVRAPAQDKFRQINKYVEILDGVLRQVTPRGAVLNIVDMGAGKGYLTFALYDHLVRTLKQSVALTGIEARGELVAQCNEIAAACGFTGLRFTQGTIAAADCAGADVVIALHACDTATDDALAKAVAVGASRMVVAPCCHKQIRRDMHPPAATLPLMLRHGTYAERLSEMVTDSLRVALLEAEGYRCKLFEFIADAHTPKNVMIVAEKLAQSRPASQHAELMAAIATLKETFGIDRHALEDRLKK